MTYYDTILMLVITIMMGLAIGSFLNVVIYRVPNGISLMGRSACPVCKTQIKEYDNIPVLSWMLLKAKCRECQTSISKRYPIVEAITAILFVGVGFWNGFNLYLIPLLVFLSISIALFMIDIDTLRLPNPLTLAAFIAVVPFYTAIGLWEGLTENIIRGFAGMLILGLGYFLLWIGSGGRGLGLGDVKLAPTIGFILAYYGWGNLVTGTFFAWLIGGIVGIVLLLVGRVGRKTQVPFGPYLILGAWIGLLFGAPLWSAYQTFW